MKLANMQDTIQKKGREEKIKNEFSHKRNQGRESISGKGKLSLKIEKSFSLDRRQGKIEIKGKSLPRK